MSCGHPFGARCQLGSASRDVLAEIAENGCPTTALLLDGEVIFGIERHLQDRPITNRNEIYDRTTISECIFNPLIGDDLGVNTLKIEAHAAVLRFHARREFAALPKINARGRTMPVVG